MDKKKFAQAALDAIEAHIAEEIGTAPISQWTDHDVTDCGILYRSLSENGLSSTDKNAALLEDVVSPLVFWQYHGESPDDAVTSSEVEKAIAVLASGGISFSIQHACQNNMLT